MRKQLAIGLSVLMLTGIGGISEKSVSNEKQDFSQQYFSIETEQHPIFKQISTDRFLLSIPTRYSYQTAAVYSITGNKKLNFGELNFEDVTVDQCKREGYTYTQTTCTGTRWASGFCPYNSGYFKECCLRSYKYDKSECTPPRKISSTSCGGKYICTCSSTTYPYKSCASPKDLAPHPKF